MTILIAHRGLLDGPNLELENTPKTLELARTNGYDVELDLWFVDGRWFLGHDNPSYPIEFEWLQFINRTNYLDQHHALIHTKNIEALYELTRRHWDGHMFFHDKDAVVLTSSKFLWTYPGQTLTTKSVCLMPEWDDTINRINELDVYAICTDYVKLVETAIRTKN